MKLWRALAFIFLSANVLLLDFPGAKIACAGALLLVIALKLYTNRVNHSLRLNRSLETDRLFQGIGARNSLILENSLLIPVHALIVSDSCDIRITSKSVTHYCVTLKSRSRVNLDYSLVGRVRGKYTVGPTAVRFTDPAGLFSFYEDFETQKDLFVFPNIFKIANPRFKSMQPQGAIKSILPIFEDSTALTGSRNYQPGDDIKRINWKASARCGAYVVNTYQPTIAAGSMIFLNLFGDDFGNRNKSSHIEFSIETAASLLNSLHDLRQDMGFTSNCHIDEEMILLHAMSKGDHHYSNILQSLSVMYDSGTISLIKLLTAQSFSLSWGTSIYILTPGLDTDTLAKLIQLHHAGHGVTVINTGPGMQDTPSLWNIGIRSYYAQTRDGVISFIRQ